MENAGNGATKEEGLRLMKAGQIDEAIAVFEKVLAADPDNAQVHMYLGVAYNHKHNKLHAVHHLEASLNLQETAKGYYNLGLVYQESHRIDEAVRQFKMAIELDPNYELARKALDALHSQHAATHPQAAGQPTPAAQAPTAPGQPTPAPGATTQTPASGQAGVPGAPVQVGAPMAGMPGSPPDLSQTRLAASFTLMQARKEQEIKDARGSMMKGGLTYGAICGAIFITLCYYAVGLYTGMIFTSNLVAMTAIVFFGGAIYGSLIGLWVGITCGGDTAGMHAGAALGALAGLVIGLIIGAGIYAIVPMVIGAILSGVVGMFVGRMVEASIQQI